MDFIIKIFIIEMVLFVHEFGHYLKMRKYNISVEEICIGVGPIIFKKRLKNGVFLIKLIPILAYVLPKNEYDFTKGNRKRLEKNLRICLAGPNLNLITGLFVFALTYFIIFLSGITNVSPQIYLICSYIDIFVCLSIGGFLVNLIPLFITDGAKAIKILLKMAFDNPKVITALNLLFNIAGFLVMYLLFKIEFLVFYWNL